MEEKEINPEAGAEQVENNAENAQIVENEPLSEIEQALNAHDNGENSIIVHKKSKTNLTPIKKPQHVIVAPIKPSIKPSIKLQDFIISCAT